MRYVLDASVAIKWCIPEPGSEVAEQFLEDLKARRLSFLAPDILVAEVGNALWKVCVLRKQLSPSTAEESLLDFLSPPIELRPSTSLATRAFHVAQNLQCPFYDALYLALAVEEKCELLTADTALLRRAAGKLPARGITEP
ncbi:MAG: type II toxin-antitoxin system VapC family toxin [Terriglobales bacterium]